MRANGRFQFRYHGQPLIIDSTGAAAAGAGRAGQVNAVAALAGNKPALLVLVDDSPGQGLIYLVWEEGDEVKTSEVGVSADSLRASPLTEDTAPYYRTRDWRSPGGRFDTDYFAVPGHISLSGCSG